MILHFHKNYQDLVTGDQYMNIYKQKRANLTFNSTTPRTWRY